MRYIALIYSNEAQDGAMDEAAQGEMFARYGAFTQEVQAKGYFHSGEPLQPTSTATTVRVRDGKTQTTDGPFAETREQLGGFYILDCPSLDTAIEMAAKIPAAENGSIEVRPILEMPGM